LYCVVTVSLLPPSRYKPVASLNERGLPASIEMATKAALKADAITSFTLYSQPFFKS
jgi:hypothetical protein